MGMFSWDTSDTKESIGNKFSGCCRPVYMLTPTGNVLEPAYEGYGKFGGIDAHVWLAEMNAAEGALDGLSDDEKREIGIKIEFAGGAIAFPLKFSFDKDAKYEDLPAATPCEYQGFFYGFW